MTSDRSPTRQQLARELEKLRRAVDHSPVSIVITDTSGVIEYVNPYFCELTGYAEHEALGKRPSILRSGRHSAEHYANLWKTLRAGQVWRGEFINRKRSGELYWESSTISPVRDEHGTVTHYVAVKEDVTKRKQAEQELIRSEARYRQLVEGTDNIIVRTDPAGRLAFVNAAAATLLGLDDQSWQGRTIFDFIHPDDRRASEEALRQWITGRVERTRYESRLLPPDGPARSISWDMQIQYDEDGPEAVNAIGRDITEQKHLERLRQDVERITRHDLKSPLLGILSVPQVLLAADNLDETQRALLKSLEESGFRMLSMINLSLDLYKMEMGTYRFQPQVLDLVPVVRKVLDDTLSSRRRKELEGRILVEGEPAGQDASFPVLAEELLCYSLLGNLVGNAADAAPASSAVTIDMSAHGDTARLAIHNQGTVPAAVRGRFFEKYVTSGKADGTGLGTYSAKLIAETQGGSVGLASDENSGTRVTITFRRPG